MERMFLIKEENVKAIQETLNSLIKADRILSDTQLKEVLHDFETTIKLSANPWVICFDCKGVIRLDDAYVCMTCDKSYCKEECLETHICAAKVKARN